MKWGEYASEVQLILRRSTPENNKTNALPSRAHTSRTNGLPVSLSEQGTGNNNTQDDNKNMSGSQSSEFDEVQGGLERNRDTRKSLTFSGFHGGITEGGTEVSPILMRNNVYIYLNLNCKHTKQKCYFRFKWKMWL